MKYSGRQLVCKSHKKVRLFKEENKGFAFMSCFMSSKGKNCSYQNKTIIS